MATAYQNLSSYDFDSVPDASKMRIGIVVAEWNKTITEKLLEGAATLSKSTALLPKTFRYSAFRAVLN
jgi:6,7-dimethyl-8-ribityllumazine synthase.